MQYLLYCTNINEGRKEIDTGLVYRSILQFSAKLFPLETLSESLKKVPFLILHHNSLFIASITFFFFNLQLYSF